MNHYQELLKRYKLDEKDHDYLVGAGYTVLIGYADDMTKAIDVFYGSDCSVEAIDPLLADLADKSGIDRYTVNFIFLAAASERMMNDFTDNGYGEALFWDTIIDLKYKLYECKHIKGVLGNFVIGWYPIFYKLKIFTLGRLQFEKTEYPKDLYEKNGVKVKKGDPVYFIHIPSSGPLTEELRYDSYRRAYEFFAEERGDGPLVCICDSWLLYENNKQIFPSKMNLVKFLHDWDIVESTEDENFSEAWRIFGVPYTGDPKALPQKSSMQKAMVEWLEQGGNAGTGFGVLVFDGEKIINND